MRKATVITLTDSIRDILTKYSKSYCCPGFLKQRSKFILLAEAGVSNKDIAAEAGVHFNTVKMWRNRFASELERLIRIEEKEPEKLKESVEAVLTDAERSGTPYTFAADIRVKIQLLACQDPKDYGFEASHWSLSLLQKALMLEKIVEDISIGAIHYILKTARIRPWKIRYYLHSKEKYESYETYSEKIARINALYANADDLLEQDTLLYCTDEMTCIQAKEHQYPDKPTLPGMDARMDFNYVRHSTTTLIGFFNVQNGQVFEPFLNKTRTDGDFVEALSMVINANPDKKHVFVLDNLNVHRSEALVRYVADKIHFTGNLGEKRKHGILKDMESRTEFLSDESHPIRFCYVPIHCSWMNQIEIWFGVIGRRLLKRQSFNSLQEMEESICKFIKQYNELFAHPYNWKYDKVPEMKEYSAEELLGLQDVA